MKRLLASAHPHNLVPLMHQSSFGLHPLIGSGDEEKWTPFQTGKGYYLGINFEGQPTLVVSINGSLYYCTANKKIEINQWTHVGAIKKGGTLQLYVNGNMVQETIVPNESITTSNTPLIIGENNILIPGADAGGAGNPLTKQANFFGFEGLLDEMKISI